MASRLAPVTALLLLAVGSFAARQSPINIVTKDADFVQKPDLEYFNYDNILSKYSLENTGHSAQISLSNRKFTPTVTGGPLGDKKFLLQQVHFHWGKDASVGSEHLINGESTSMEVHLVHYNSDYSSFAEAAKQDDGLAVVGFLIDGASSGSSFNPEFQKVVNELSKIAHPKDKVSSKQNLLRWVVPFLEPKGYYSYPGSLTTEPYSENVSWIVYDDPILIKKTQVDAFRALHGSEHELTENFRGLQPLEGRKVEYVPDF